MATLLPANYEFVDDGCHVLVPGFAIFTAIRTPRNEIVRVGNLYLHPGHQASIWQQAVFLLPDNSPADPSMLMVGDLNTNLAVSTPLAGSLLHEIASQWGVLRTTNSNWRGRTDERELDGGIVPFIALPTWIVTSSWTSLSDHAVLTF